MTSRELGVRIKTQFKVTYLLIGINVAVFLVTTVLTFALNGNDSGALALLGANFFPAILQGDVSRMLLSAFLHANIVHLFINMWALLNIGLSIEMYYGGKKLFSTYVLTAIAGSFFSFAASIVTIFLTHQTGNAFPISVGASGAIFGLIGLLIGNSFKKDTYSPRIPVNSQQLWFFVIFNVLFGVGINFLGTSFGIDNWAHIGGLVGGIALGRFMEPITVYYQSRLKKFIEQSLFWLSLLLVIMSVVVHLLFLFVF